MRIENQTGTLRFTVIPPAMLLAGAFGLAYSNQLELAGYAGILAGFWLLISLATLSKISESGDRNYNSNANYVHDFDKDEAGQDDSH